MTYQTCLVFHGKNLNKLELEINNEMEKIEEWFNANKLTINVNKTAAMIIQPISKKKNAHLISSLIKSTFL